MDVLTASKARELVREYLKEEPKRVQAELKRALSEVEWCAKNGTFSTTITDLHYRDEVVVELEKLGFGVNPIEVVYHALNISWKEETK